MRIIEHIIEPSRLLVIWQPDPKGKGKRYVVGEVWALSEGISLQYYDNEETQKAVERGFSGMFAQPYEAGKIYHDGVQDTLAKRLPAKTRADYNDFLRSFCLDKAIVEDASLLALLGYTGGKLTGDGFSFAHTFENATAPFELTFEIAGFRHCDGMKQYEDVSLLLNTNVDLVPDNNCEHDPNAVQVIYHGVCLGYIPHGLAKTMRQIMAGFIFTAEIVRVNGTKERPRILVFVRAKEAKK